MGLSFEISHYATTNSTLILGGTKLSTSYAFWVGIVSLAGDLLGVHMFSTGVGLAPDGKSTLQPSWDLESFVPVLMSWGFRGSLLRFLFLSKTLVRNEGYYHPPAPGIFRLCNFFWIHLSIELRGYRLLSNYHGFTN